MQKILQFLTLALLLCTYACAESAPDPYGASRLERALTPPQRQLIEGASPTAPTDFLSQLGKLISQAISDAAPTAKKAMAVCGGILAVLILTAVAANYETEASHQITKIAGVFAVTLLCTSSLRSMLGLAQSTTDEIRAFSDLLLPVMSGTLAASGAPTAAAGLYAGTVLFMDILQRILSSLFVPLVYAYLALCCAECAMDDRLQKIRELIGFLIRVGLKGVMYLFCAYLAITEIVGKSTDAATLKAAKATLSAVIPVVGSVAAGAADSVLSGAQMLKNTAGVFGLLAFLAIGVGPFLEIGIHYLILKLSAAVGGTMSKDAAAKMTERLSEAMGFMLAICGCGVLMALVSCCCFLRSGGS